MVWLITVTMTASWQKIFSVNARIGFLSGANALAAQIAAGKIPAAKIAEIQRTIFNLRLDAVVTAVLAAMILVLVFEALLRWTAILTKRSEAVLQETPYVATQWIAGAEGN
jgi:carbon starvation protein